ncbi:glutathione-dependent formaldehyde dehydrogenase [Fibrella sp. USSR17]
MKALTFQGRYDLRSMRVPDPFIVDPQDVILRVIGSATCGSDLHLLNGYIPTMMAGDIIGHEFMGEVVEIGPGVKNLRRGDRVVVAASIGCGDCAYCQNESWSLCDNSNPNAYMVEPMFGDAPAALYGYSHSFGGYAGGHAEYVRVPFADKGCFVVPESIRNDQAIACADAFPTGYMAASMADIKPGDIVAVWGAGGVGQMAMQSAWLMGAGRVICIDREPARLALAAKHCKAEILDFSKVDVLQALKEMTAGRGVDCCIDAVGTEAVDDSFQYYMDKAKQYVRIESDRPLVLRQMIIAAKKGGNLSIVGVYGGFVDSIPMGAAMNKGLTWKMGQLHAQKYIPTLFQHIEKGDVDPSYLFTHTFTLDQGMTAYDTFNRRADGIMKAVLLPSGTFA